MSGSLSYQPVVPTTILPPVASTARIFCTAASGVVKSIATSNPVTNGGVNAPAPEFSSTSSTCTPWPRSAATSETSFPVFPCPSTSIRIATVYRAVPAIAVARCKSGSSLGRNHPGVGVEHGWIGVLEELRVQRPDRLIHIRLLDHEAHVDLARALRDHAHVDVPDRRKHLAGDPAAPANVFAHHADQRLVPFQLHVRHLAQLGADLRQPLVRVHGYRDAHLAGRNHVDH